MIRLISSEALRMRSRRLVKVLSLVALAGIVIAMTIAAVQSRRPGAEELERAERRAERVVQDCIAQGGFGAVEPGGDVEAFCRREIDPSGFVDTWSLRLSELPDVLRGLSFIAILIGLVIGASAVGASWQSGTFTTILVWEPRRMRVALVRASVVAVGVFVLVAALLGTFVALYSLTASVRGVTQTPQGWSSDVAGVLARVSALAAAASVIGGAIAMIGRNTAAALGGVFVYLTVVEGVLRGLRPRLGWFLLGDNIAAVVNGTGLQIGDGTLTAARAGLTVAVYTFVLLAIATVSFQVRDVQ